MSGDGPPEGRAGGWPEDWHAPNDLSSLLDGDEGTTGLPSQVGGEHGSVMVIAGIDLAPASPYVTQVLPNDDTVIELPYDRAVAYAMAVLAAAHRAHYLAAVLAQARDILGGRGRGRGGAPAGRGVDDNARFLMDQLLQDLPELDAAATAPLWFQPVILKDGSASVRVSLPPHREAVTGWTFAEACNHAHNVLAQAIVSQLDTAYRTVISVGFEAGEQKGRAAVHDLGNYYPHADYGQALDEAGPPAPGVPGPAPGVPGPAPGVPGPAPGARPAGRRGGSKKDRRRRG